jgi:Tetratricopeptide repeat
MAPRGRFQRYPSSTTTPYHSKGTRTGVFPAYFTDGSYWRVLTVHLASLEAAKGRLHLSGRHCRMMLFAHLRRLSDVLDRAVVVGDSAAQITLGLVCVAAIGEKIRPRRNSNRLVIDPKLSLAFRDRGAAYYFNKDYERAIKDYDKAIKLDPRSDRAYSTAARSTRSLAATSKRSPMRARRSSLNHQSPPILTSRSVLRGGGRLRPRRHRLTQLSPTPQQSRRGLPRQGRSSTERSQTTKQRCVSIRGLRQPLRTLRPYKLCASGQ